MNDVQTTIATIKEMVRSFVEEREWGQFHEPKNLSMNIAAEAAELMEIFMWCTAQETRSVLDKRRSDVEDELADVLMAVVAFANAANIDMVQVFLKKLEKTKKKYPVDKVRGKVEKYTEYSE